MQGKVTAAKSVVAVLVVCLCAAAAQASVTDKSPSISAFNPWSPVNMAVETSVDRTLAAGAKLPHAGMCDFSSWSLFTDYTFGSNQDKRNGGFDNNFNSYTIGADTLYNTNTLWGFMVNNNESQDHMKGVNNNRVTTESWTYSLYVSQPVNEWMSWGTSFSYGTSEIKQKGVAGTTDADSYVIAPYLAMYKQIDKLTLSMSPSYVLGYQELDYPAGNVPNDDTGLMGRFVLMNRASYALTEKLNISANLNFNQVLHNHGLDGVVDNDHQWWTTGAKLGYKFTSNLSGSVGYSTEFDSDYDSDIWSMGLAYMF